MESAFGIDHGYDEIEKASLGGFGSLLARGTRTAATGLSRSSAGLRRGAPAGGFKQKLGVAGGHAAGGLRKLGQGMAARPGLTGGAALGAGGAAVGGGIGMAANRRRY